MYKDTVYCELKRYSVLRCTKIECIAMYTDRMCCDVKDTVYYDVQRYSVLRCTKILCIAMYKD